MKKTSFLITVLVAIIFYSCQESESEQLAPFAEVADIATFHGNLNADIAIVNTQGGPEIQLDDEVIQEIMMFTQTSNLLYVNVHQIQTKQPEKFVTNDISFEAAKQYDEQSIGYLKEVVTHLKSQGKTVYVLGISFGAFVTQELIADYGTDIADGFLIAAGRLDIDEDTWVPFSQGKSTAYLYDQAGNYSINEMGEGTTAEERNMWRLAAGLGFNRFTEKLAGFSDLSKVIYAYGDRDQEVGPLSVKEVQFLQERGAKLAFSANSDHDGAILTGLEILKSIFEE